MDTSTYIKELRHKMEEAKDPLYAIPMRKYMKNKFEFLGIKSPSRKLILKDFLKDCGLPSENDVEIILKSLWELPEREFQYCAMTIAEKRLRILNKDFFPVIEFMIKNKSWWDTVDYIAANIAGGFFRRYPEFVPRQTDLWNASDNIWFIRTSVLFQLKYKKKTDLELLRAYILPHTSSSEFFIQKSIGWILREYSKTDPDWVLEFVSKNKLAPLSVREGLKWLNRH